MKRTKGTPWRTERKTRSFPISDSELQEDSVIRNFRITAADGKTYNTKHYKLPAIIAVGYKVNSERILQDSHDHAGLGEPA
jgi:hypothetical protein